MNWMKAGRIILITIGLILILAEAYILYKNKTSSKSDLFTKELTLESVDKNDNCGILNCKSTKVMKFKEINQSFEIPDPKDTPQQLKVVLDQLSQVGNVLEAQVYKLNDKECVHSVAIKGDTNKLLDYTNYYQNNSCYPQKPRSLISIIEIVFLIGLLII